MRLQLLANTRRRTMLWALALVTAAVGALLSAPSARAATTPQLKWPALTLSGERFASRVTTVPDGSLKISGGNAADLYNVSPDGKLSSQVPSYYANSASDLVLAVDKNGTTYAYADGNSMKLAAFKGASEVWRLSLPCPISALRLGVDGNIYLVASGAGSVDACPSPRLIGVKATLAAGATSPAKLFDTDLGSDTNVVPDGLAAYNSGLVVHTTRGMRYFSLSGSSIRSIQEQLLYGGSRGFAATTSGRVFGVRPANEAASMLCGNKYGLAGGISVFEPSGKLGNISLPACSTVHTIRPTPSGGAVVEISHPNQLGTQQLRQLVGYASNGSQSWSVELTGSDPDNHSIYTGATYLVDGRGQTLLSQTLVRSGNGSSQNQYAVRLSLLSANGANVGSYNFEGDAFPADDGDRSANSSGYFARSGSIAASDNTAYLLAAHCAPYDNCDADVSLYAVNIPGLAMDYPRGELMASKQPAPKRVYAALGDSFSSGEGVTPFEAGSDNPVTAGPEQYDLCHRSKWAYPRLLAGDEALKLEFKTLGKARDTFVACSGATSERLTVPWPAKKPDGTIGPNTREGIQKDALDTSTNLVTLSYGGNDIGFSRFVRLCLFVDCSRYDREFTKAAANLQLASTYRQILSSAPNARVYVVGYPQLLPQKGCSKPGMQGLDFVLKTLVQATHTGTALDVRRPQFVKDWLHKYVQLDITYPEAADIVRNPQVKFSDAELRTANQLVKKLDDRIRSQVRQADGGQGRLVYIDPLAKGSPFAGHELCTAKPYFNGLVINPANAMHDLAYSFHPNTSGQNAYFRLVRPYVAKK